MFSRKDTRLSPRYTFAFQGSLGTRLAQPVVLFTQKSTLTFGELLSCRTVCVNACHASNSATTAIDNQYICTIQLWSWTAIRCHFVCVCMYNSTVCEAMSASSSYNEQTALMKQLPCNFTSSKATVNNVGDCWYNSKFITSHEYLQNHNG